MRTADSNVSSGPDFGNAESFAPTKALELEDRVVADFTFEEEETLCEIREAEAAVSRGENQRDASSVVRFPRRDAPICCTYNRSVNLGFHPLA